MRLVLLGPPGAGKGTQATQLAATMQIPHIATGDIFRDHVRNATALGLTAKAHMDRGELVSDEIVIGMVTARVCESDMQNGYLLDGFPRTVRQAEALEAFLQEAGQPLDAVLCFRIAEELVVERIVGRRTCPADGSVYHLRFAAPQVAGRCDACGAELIHRTDDAEDVVRRRLAEYRAKTLPLEVFYAERSILVEIDADGSVAEVASRALAVVERLSRVGGGIDIDDVIDVTSAALPQSAG